MKTLQLFTVWFMLVVLIACQSAPSPQPPLPVPTVIVRSREFPPFPERRNLTNRAFLSIERAVYSPTGDRMAVIATQEDASDPAKPHMMVFVADLSEKYPVWVPMTPRFYGFEDLVWGPQGDKIAISGTDATVNHVVQVIPVRRGGAKAYQSPPDYRNVYAQFDGHGRMYYLSMGMEERNKGKEERLIFRDTEPFLSILNTLIDSFAISPDGSMVAYTKALYLEQAVQQVHSFCVMVIATKKQQCLDTELVVYPFEWTADQTSIYYSVLTKNPRGVESYKMDVLSWKPTKVGSGLEPKAHPLTSTVLLTKLTYQLKDFPEVRDAIAIKNGIEIPLASGLAETMWAHWHPSGKGLAFVGHIRPDVYEVGAP